jgi:alpha-L-fucosidase
VPDGVVNDRWGDTHRDYRTSEYQHSLDSESAAAWENCRGIGLSFGYNQVEDSRHLMSGPQLVRHLVDVVSRGGNLLLNVGPTASGLIPRGQRDTLEALAGWMAVHSGVVHGSRPLDAGIAEASDEPWVRWTRTGDRAWAVVDASGRCGGWKSAEPAGRVRVALPARADRLALASAALADGTPVTAQADPAGIAVELPSRDAPVAVGFDIR